MSDRGHKIRILAESLVRLVEFAPNSTNSLDDWYGLARSLEAELVAAGGLGHEVPHFLWHYLADADIRMKDEEYAKIQGRRVNLLLDYLKRGTIPSDEDIFDPVS